MRQYNLPLLQKVRTVGRYDMPMLAKQDVTTPDTLMGSEFRDRQKDSQALRNPFLHR